MQEQQEGIFEGEIAFYIADPLELDTLLEHVEAIGSIDWDNHILRENDFQYEQIAGQLQNLQNLAVALIAIASVLSIVILMLILMMRIRGRIHEAGIYLSVGKSKAAIIGQFTLEAWVLLFTGFLLAFLLWLLCSDTVNGLCLALWPREQVQRHCRPAAAHLITCSRICFTPVSCLPGNWELSC